MELRGFFRGKGAQDAQAIDAPADVAASLVIGDAERLAMLDSLEASGTSWFWATNSDHDLVYLSAGAHTAFAQGEALLGTPFKDLFASVSQDEEHANDRPITFLLSAKNKITDLPVRLLGKRDQDAWWSLVGRPHFDAENNFLGYRGSAKDITESFQKLRESSRMAQYDELTGLSNRHRMSSRLTRTLTTFDKTKRFCSLLMLDLDRFKQVNDTLGHPAGDELLRQVAQRLQRIVPENAEVGRLGGDEFQIMLPDIDDRGQLGELATRIVQMLSQPYSIEGSRAIIGTSVGIAVFPYDGENPEELVKAADLALYAAKGAGRGQYRFYSSELRDTAIDHRAIEEDLRDALESDQLEMYYQPMVETATGKVCTFEAVIRWNHPERGMISPATFMPIAEETNLILKLGEWILRRSCLDAAQWPEALKVSINISAHQFRQDNLPQIVSSAMLAANLHPSRVELEITETVFIGDKTVAEAMFTRLKALGVRLSLDDFGTGYSSLGYLRGAPFDKIKIDKSFVDDCTNKDDSSLAIITAIIALAKALDMQTTAEGVEAHDQLEVMKGLGADQIQGFIYSKPIAQQQVLEKLASGDFSFRAIGPKHHRSGRRAMFRKVSIIHEDHRYHVVLRNLSRTGAMIEGLLGVSKGTELLLDLGGGQLVVGKVQRSWEARQGLLFEVPLISDGADGLCTRHRVPPNVLEATERRLRLEKGNTMPCFMQVSVQPGGLMDL